jgi:hypothetical protein
MTHWPRWADLLLIAFSGSLALLSIAGIFSEAPRDWMSTYFLRPGFRVANPPLIVAIIDAAFWTPLTILLLLGFTGYNIDQGWGNILGPMVGISAVLSVFVTGYLIRSRSKL